MDEKHTSDTNTISHDTINDFYEYKVAMVIWQYVPPVLILLGTMGSILSVAVLTRKKLKSLTTTFYLVLLALADVTVLHTGLLRHWVTFTFNYDMRLMSRFSCKFHTHMVYVSLDFSAWVVVALTIERCLCVCLPMRVWTICKIQYVRVVSAAILLLLSAINMHYFWTVDLVERTMFGIRMDCYAASTNAKLFMENVWPWIDFCVVCFLPFGIMIVCNILIIRQVIKSSRKFFHKHYPTSPIQVTDNLTVQQISTLPSRYDQQEDSQRLSRNLHLKNDEKQMVPYELKTEGPTISKSNYSIVTPFESIIPQDLHGNIPDSKTMRDAVPDIVTEFNIVNSKISGCKSESSNSDINNKISSISMLLPVKKTNDMVPFESNTTEGQSTNKSDFESLVEIVPSESRTLGLSQDEPGFESRREIVPSECRTLGLLQDKPGFESRREIVPSESRTLGISQDEPGFESRREIVPPESRTMDDPSENKRNSCRTKNKRGCSQSTTRNISSLTVMLLSVNGVFLLLMSPIVIFLIGSGRWKDSPDPRVEARLMLAWSVVNMLQYTNNAIHFFLYYLTVPSFRILFLSMCKRSNKVSP